MYPNETTRAYIYVTAKQFQHKQSQKGAKFTHKIHKIAILRTSRARYNLNLYELTVKINLRHCSRVIYNCATLKSKYYRRDNLIQKEANPACLLLPIYYCYTACIIGFQFVTRSSTRYRIVYRRSALKVFIAGVTSFITRFLSGQLKVFYIVEFLQIS